MPLEIQYNNYGDHWEVKNTEDYNVTFMYINRPEYSYIIRSGEVCRFDRTEINQHGIIATCSVVYTNTPQATNLATTQYTTNQVPQLQQAQVLYNTLLDAPIQNTTPPYITHTQNIVRGENVGEFYVNYHISTEEKMDESSSDFAIFSRKADIIRNINENV